MTTSKGRLARNRRLCPGCGEPKRARWPTSKPVFCAKDCAAGAALNQYEAGSQDFYCVVCGDVGCGKEHD